MDTDDFVEAPLNLPRGACCPRCKVCKPLKSFTKLLTYAQSMALGKVGNVHMRAETKLCNACHPNPRPKRITKLTKRELYNRAASGELRHPELMERVSKLDVLTSLRRAKAADKRWAYENAWTWAPTQEALTNAFQRTRRLLKMQKCDPSEFSAFQRARYAPEFGNREEPALIALLEAHLAALHTVRKAVDANSSQRLKPLPALRDYLLSSERETLDAKLRAVPAEYLTCLRKPLELLSSKPIPLPVKPEKPAIELPAVLVAKE